MSGYPQPNPENESVRGLSRQDANAIGTDLYAAVGPDGIVVFEKNGMMDTGRLPLLRGPAREVQQTVKRWTSLHHDGVSYYLPSVAVAPSEMTRIDAVTRWREFLEKRMEEDHV